MSNKHRKRAELRTPAGSASAAAAASAAKSPRAGRHPRVSRHRRPFPWMALSLLAVVGLALFFVLRSFEIGAPGEHIAVSGVGQHVPEGQSVSYSSVPPVGGPHWGAPAGWGVSSTQLPDERAVHNLEHGGVVIDYNGVAPETLAALKNLMGSYPRDKFNEVKIVLAPYDKLPTGQIVLTAWGWKQLLAAYDEHTVRAFLDAHLNQCCESVP